MTELMAAAGDARFLRNKLNIYIEALTRLHDLSGFLTGQYALPIRLQMILETLVDLHGACFGLLSVCDPETGMLYDGASVGFDQKKISLLTRVMPGPDADACGAAFATVKRIIVEDTEADLRFGNFRGLARDAGFRAVHSTPILIGGGGILGVIVHFRTPRRPARREMQIADICARYAAQAMESAAREAEIPASP